MSPQPLNDNKQGTRPRAHLELLQDQKEVQYRSFPSSSAQRNVRSYPDTQHTDNKGPQRRHVGFKQSEFNSSNFRGNEQHEQRQRTRRSPARPLPVPGNPGTNAMMGSPYGMMHMGGTGYGGMGYGVGGMGYGGMGYGMGGMMGPMNMIYSINYFIAMIGQITTMLGMSTQAVGHLYHIAREALLRVEQTIRQSEVRRWLQRKSKQSPLLRGMLVLASMLAASQVVRFLRFLVELQMKRSGWFLGNGTSVSVPAEVADAAGSIGAVASIANGQQSM